MLAAELRKKDHGRINGHVADIVLRNRRRVTTRAFRLAMGEVSVGDDEIRITGSKAVLARAAAQGLDNTPPGVLSFVREWRARKECIRTSYSVFSKSGVHI